MPERITQQLLAVLAVLDAEPARDWYGFELMELTQLTSGTLYPILHRLVKAGWLKRTGRVPSDRGGPVRRLYRMTSRGERAVRDLLAARLASQPGRR